MEVMAMDKRIKDLWVRALRSGEFKQCKGQLEKDGKYCALGVLSILALIEGQCTYLPEGKSGRFDHKKFKLSFNIMKWARIAQEEEKFLNSIEQEVKIHYKGRPTTIARLNDLGISFLELADLIEKQL